MLKKWQTPRGSRPLYKSTVRHFTFTDIPKSGKGWTLDVCAMSFNDARQYVKNVHHGGKFVGENVKAMCGATTQAARDSLAESLEKWLNETE